jgi:hypothetical protein
MTPLHPKVPHAGSAPKAPKMGEHMKMTTTTQKINKPYQGMKSSAGSNSTMGGSSAMTSNRVTGGY